MDIKEIKATLKRAIDKSKHKRDESYRYRSNVKDTATGFIDAVYQDGYIKGIEYAMSVIGMFGKEHNTHNSEREV